MAKITYQDKVDLYENANVQHINKVIADDMNEIKEAVNDNENKILIAISDTAPSECSVGDLYYNTSTKKIYEAIDVDTWDENGTDPTSNTIYILFDTKTTYSYDGNDLVSVGGGGAEIFVGDTLPSGDDADSIKLWLTDDDALEGEGKYISNEYGTSQEIGYSQEYLNGKVLYEDSTSTVGNITLNDSLANYSRIVLLMKQSDNNYWWTEVMDEPNGKTLWITKLQVDRTQSRYYLFEKRYTCSGTSINKAFIGTYFSNTNTYSEYDNLRIMKVIGYK